MKLNKRNDLSLDEIYKYENIDKTDESINKRKNIYSYSNKRNDDPKYKEDNSIKNNNDKIKCDNLSNNNSIQIEKYIGINNKEEEIKLQEKMENENINESNILNYNYLDNVEEGYNKSLEETINDLKNENTELRNDMKKLYFLTQENKNNLIEHIKMLKNENFILKKEKNDLEYCLLSKERKINELTADNEKLVNDNKKNELKYLDEIKELNCQLNNYKLQLNKLKLDYDQLSNDFNYFKKISNE